MHDQDVRRAVDRPGGYDTPVAEHVLALFGGALPMVWGKRVGAPVGAVGRLVLSDRPGWQHTARVGEDGRAVRDDAATPTTEVALTAEDYVVLSGGRRGVEATDPEISGDEELGRRLLASLAVTP